ncbi:MAG: preprotein translocase subunit SecE [Patescibacteria group bacterium]
MITKILDYLHDTKTELKRVVWPSRQDTTRHTLAVIGISVVVAVFLGTLDILFQFLLEKFIL